MKVWWKNEPLVIGSVRWKIISNDLYNNILDAVKQLKPTATINEAVKIANDKGLEISFKLV